MLLISVLVLCAILYCDVSGQICRKRTVIIKWVYEDYRYSYVDRYTKKNWYGRVVSKTRVKTASGSRPVQKQEVDFVPTCCDGYIRTDSGSLDDIECTPICTPACENGKCVSPGECECNEGYSLAEGSPHKCLPTCEECHHGTCVGPNACHCDYGYSIQNGTACLPICTEPCVNSACIAPDTCQCHYGYRKTDGNLCTPYCSRGCFNGICTDPETCVCNNGWHKSDKDQCVPKCDPQCGNGTCKEPNHCKCNAGYEANEGNNPVCVPHCNVTCGNGTCVTPDTCECESGYTIDDKKEPRCVPRCDTDCGNGTCIAPNECECNKGYDIDIYSNPVCKPQCDVKCGNGTCISPDTCECETGYKENRYKDPICVPHCMNECRNGLCIAPNQCECNEGYKQEHISTDAFPICVPKCDIVCGNGSCVAPNLCKCLPGYKLDVNKNCTPDCGNCEGNCLAGECKCNEPFKATPVTVDGKACQENTNNCTRIICKLDAATTTEGISYGYDDIETNATIGMRPTSDINISEPYGTWYDYYDGVIGNNTLVLDSDVENQIQGSEYWMQSKWEYAVISIVVIILAIILGSLLIFRTSIKEYCKGGGVYQVEDDKIEDPENIERLADGKIRMSTIMKKREGDDSVNEV